MKNILHKEFESVHKKTILEMSDALYLESQASPSQIFSHCLPRIKAFFSSASPTFILKVLAALDDMGLQREKDILQNFYFNKALLLPKSVSITLVIPEKDEFKQDYLVVNMEEKGRKCHFLLNKGSDDQEAVREKILASLKKIRT